MNDLIPFEGAATLTFLCLYNPKANTNRELLMESTNKQTKQLKSLKDGASRS